MRKKSDGELIAEGLHALAQSIDKLGINGAGTNMGAIELLSKEIKEGCALISNSLNEVSRSIDWHAKQVSGAMDRN